MGNRKRKINVKRFNIWGIERENYDVLSKDRDSGDF